MPLQQRSTVMTYDVMSNNNVHIQNPKSKDHLLASPRNYLPRVYSLLDRYLASCILYRCCSHISRIICRFASRIRDCDTIDMRRRWTETLSVGIMLAAAVPLVILDENKTGYIIRPLLEHFKTGLLGFAFPKLMISLLIFCFRYPNRILCLFVSPWE